MKILDMHCDTISELLDIRRKGDAVRIKENTLRSNGLHIDLEKMKKADYLLQNFALFVHLSSCENPLEEVLELADVYYDELDKNKDLIRPVYSYADIESNRKAGLMSAMLTVEEGGVCKGNPAFLRTLYRLGVRMLTSYMPLLIDAFGKAGFTSSQVDKILSGNVLRVYKEVLV